MPYDRNGRYISYEDERKRERLDTEYDRRERNWNPYYEADWERHERWRREEREREAEEAERRRVERRRQERLEEDEWLERQRWEEQRYYAQQQPPEPTDEELCEAHGGHAYHGDDDAGGRCYCGKVRYPRGGPKEDTPP